MRKSQKEKKEKPGCSISPPREREGAHTSKKTRRPTKEQFSLENSVVRETGRRKRKQCKKNETPYQRLYGEDEKSGQKKRI